MGEPSGYRRMAGRGAWSVPLATAPSSPPETRTADDMIPSRSSAHGFILTDGN